MNILKLIYNNWPAFSGGIKVTFQLASISWITGFFLGGFLGALSFKYRKSLGFLLSFLYFLLFSIPFLVILYWANYPFQSIIHENFDPYNTSLFLLCLINVVGVAYSFKNELISLPTEYLFAGRVCGMNTKEIIWRIQLPLIMRRIISPVLNLSVLILHMTLFTSLISVNELFRVCQRLNSSLYKPIEIYTALAVLFIVICIPINLIALYFSKKYKKLQ